MKNRSSGSFPSWLKFSAIVLITTFCWTLGGVGDAAAAWRDKSDSMPSIMEPDPPAYLYVAVGLLVVVIVYAVIKKSHNDDEAVTSSLMQDSTQTSVIDAASKTSGGAGSLDIDTHSRLAEGNGTTIAPCVYQQGHNVGVGLVVGF